MIHLCDLVLLFRKFYSFLVPLVFSQCFFVKRSANKLAHALGYLVLETSDVLEAPDLLADLAMVI